MSGVKTLHPDYNKFAPKWKRCRDIVAGQDNVHAAGPEYLPRLKDQTQEDYSAYVKRAGLYNASWRTIAGLLGMMFRKPPKIDTPPGVTNMLADVDLAGTTLDTFARIIAGEVLEVGRVGIMIDHPRVMALAKNKAESEKMGLRPSMTIYHAERIRNWKYRRINNRHMLAMVVLEESATEPDGEFAEKVIEQYRVLDLDEANLYRVRLFRKAKATDEEFTVVDEFRPVMNGKPLPFIPFAIVGTDGMDSTLDEPPLIDLVDMNLSHYRTTADYEHGCHFTGLPTAVISGYQGAEGEKLYIGSQAAWVFPDPQAKATFLEFTGQGLGALKDNLDRKEQQMAVLGARMIAAEKKQAETATTAAIHRTGENSVLSSLALAIGQSLEWALGIFAQWAGQSGEVTYELNRDYNPAMITAQELTALVAATQAGKLSDESLFDLLQRGDVVDSELTFEEEQARIEIGNPAPVRPALAA